MASIDYLLKMMKDQEKVTREILCGERTVFPIPPVSQGANFSMRMGGFNTNVNGWMADFKRPLKSEEPIEVQEKDLLPEEPVIVSQWKVEED